MVSSNDDRIDGPVWSIGTARRVITPEKPMWMAGLASRDAPAEGTEQDLRATAVAFEDRQGTFAVVVSVDSLYVPRDLREVTASRCAERYGLDPDALMVTATHTHCGPEFREFKLRMYADDVDRYVEHANAYRDRLEDKLVAVVGDAIDDREAATLSYSHGYCGFAMNRRLPVEDGIAHLPNPDGPVDHEVPVLVAERNDSPTAILFGYACHTTTLSFNQYCGDWAGFAQRYIEEEYPDATALFLMGCAGDQNPYPRRELELAKQYGQSAATAVRAAVESRRKPVHGPVRSTFLNQKVTFEGPPSRQELESMLSADERYRRLRAGALLEVLDENGEIPTEHPYPIQAFGFGGDLTLVALGGEPLVEYGLRLKEELPDPIWIAAYANAEFTYVPTTQALYEGGYEGGDVIQRSKFPGPLHPDVEDRILRGTRAVVDRVT